MTEARGRDGTQWIAHFESVEVFRDGYRKMLKEGESVDGANNGQ
jgi:hypothetical protein